MAPAVARERLTVPTAPPSAQSHARKSGHEIKLGRPNISKRGREGLELAVHQPVVVRDRDLGRDVVLLEAEMRWGHIERVEGLAGREALQLRDVYLDDEAAARFQMLRDVAEALNLRVLRGQVRDGIAY